MALRFSNPAIQYFDKATKAALAGGKLFFFEPNASTTPKTTFKESTEDNANTNPVILDGNGMVPDIFGTGSYRVVCENSEGIQQWEFDPVDFESVGGAFAGYLDTVDYSVNEIVEATDGDFYISIKTPNLGNDPALDAEPTFWSRFDLIERWNTNNTHEIGDPVTQNGKFYTSLTASNQGNDPATDSTNWLGDRTPTLQTFITPGADTWTKPANVIRIHVRAVAAGGGGGSSNTTAGDGGSGGGGGAFGDLWIDVTSIASIAMFVGTGGTGGVAGAGVSGTQTSLTGIFVLNGGIGGVQGGGNSAGGFGGALSSGAVDNVIPGENGHSCSASVAIAGSDGGHAHLGFGGRGVSGTGSGAGTGSGGGGSGGFRSTGGADIGGGNGADGKVIITQYTS